MTMNEYEFKRKIEDSVKTMMETEINNQLNDFCVEDFVSSLDIESAVTNAIMHKVEEILDDMDLEELAEDKLDEYL